MIRVILVGVAVLGGAGVLAARGDDPYFPPGVFDPGDKEENDSRAEDYAPYLRAMGEPSLWKLSKSKHPVTSYRLLWHPSFHSPISVRIVSDGKTTVLHLVKLEPDRRAQPGKVTSTLKKTLSEDDWTWLLVHLERTRFWKMRTSLEWDPNSGLILDGDDLLVEGVERGKYHVVERDDPEPEYEKLCQKMLELSGLDVAKAWEEYHGE